jgi:amino acid transporter
VRGLANEVRTKFADNCLDYKLIRNVFSIEYNKSDMKQLKDIFRITGIPVLVASLCCLAPVVLVAVGISTLAFAASLTNLLDVHYRLVFILAGFISLAVSLVLYFRKRGVCTLDQVKKHRNEIINKTLLSLIGGLILYFLFFNVFLQIVGHSLKIWQ